MSKADNQPGFKPIRESHDTPHLETTARGVALARAALAEAQVRALEAEQAHRINLEAELERERAIIKALRLEMHGKAATEAIEADEQAQSEVIAQAEAALEGEHS